MFQFMKDNYIDIKMANRLDEEKLKGKIFIGEFVDKQEPEYTDMYQQIINFFKQKEE